MPFCYVQPECSTGIPSFVFPNSGLVYSFSTCLPGGAEFGGDVPAGDDEPTDEVDVTLPDFDVFPDPEDNDEDDSATDEDVPAGEGDEPTGDEPAGDVDEIVDEPEEEPIEEVEVKLPNFDVFPDYTEDNDPALEPDAVTSFVDGDADEPTDDDDLPLFCDCLDLNGLTHVYNNGNLPHDYGNGECAAHDDGLDLTDCDVNQNAYCTALWCYVSEDC